MKKSIKQKKTLLDKIINIIIILFVISCGIYVFWKPIRNIYMSYKTNEYQIEDVTKEDVEKNKQKEVSYNFDEVKTYQTLTNFDVTTLPAIGGIAIPELGINLLVFNGLDDYSLSYGAGTMSPSQKMGNGNYSLVSHHVFGQWGWGSDLLFSPLENAQKGMKIYLTDKTNVYEYIVTETFVVDPYGTYVLDNPKENEQAEITLITCTDANATNRIVVKGKLNTIRNWNNRLPQQDKAFQMKYNY